MAEQQQNPNQIEINQTSFKGGMNLLVDDTRPTGDIETNTTAGSYKIAINQYRIGFNVRCRYDVLDPILSSAVDAFAPQGIKQGIVTFGNYIIIFVAGKAYYRLNTNTGYLQVPGFQMSTTAPRFWTVAIPVSTTNYGRLAVSATTGISGSNPQGTTNSAGGINAINISASFAGNLPGLLVQDGINQPQFIFLDINNNNQVTARTTQTYAQWNFVCDGNVFAANSTPSSPIYNTNYGNVTVDNREYVPIGTYMEWYNGILFIVATDTQNIYRSVSGRPLDFVINVDLNGQKAGDATTTSYSVGVGGITCIRATGTGLFVAAGYLACFSVSLNTTPNAPTIFGEYTFIRTFLFTAGCLSDRAIIDIIGDTAFIDLSGLRSFNAVETYQDEGRMSIFSKTVSSLFTGIVQDPTTCAAINVQDYAIFGVNTTYGYVLIVYDTINQVYSSVDIFQTNGVAVKQFASIQGTVTALYAILANDTVVQLYAGPDYDTAYVRFMSVCSQDPALEIKQDKFRCILSQFMQNSTATLQTFVNNIPSVPPQTKNITFTTKTTYKGTPSFVDVNTQVNNLIFPTPNAAIGWKFFNLLSWTGGGRITNVKTTALKSSPQQSLNTQGNTT